MRKAATTASRRRSSARGASASAAARSPGPENDGWLLRLYVAGQTPKSVAAFNNLRRICDEHLGGRYEVEIVDLVKSPQRAVEDQIIAIPTLVRRLPAPLKKIIGDLSRTDRVLVGFEIK